jgi:hypothetical protein
MGYRGVLCAGARAAQEGAATRAAPRRAVLRRRDGRGDQGADRVVRRRARAAPSGPRTHQGRAGVRDVCRRDHHVAHRPQRHGRGGRARHHPAAGLRRGGPPPRRRDRADRAPRRDRVRPSIPRAARRTAHLLQQLAADRPARESPTGAAARSRAARARCRGRISACARRRRPRCDRLDVRTGWVRPRAWGSPIPPRGHEALRGFYGRLFSNDGGIPLQHCSLIDAEGACALEYNVVRWGRTDLPPQAGVAIYVRGESGKLAAARIYDDVDPPLGPAT